MPNNIVLAAVLMILAGGGWYLARSQISISILPDEVRIVWCDLGKIATIATMCYLSGGLIALFSLIVVGDGRLWLDVARGIPIRPWGVMVWASAFLGSAMVSTLGLAVGLAAALKRTNHQKETAVV